MAYLWSILLMGILVLPKSYGARLYIAAASNFVAPLQEISQKFTHQTGHELIISYGSTGKLFAQIVNGAPFEIFLSADSHHPQKLIDQKLGISDSRFTFAVGKLILWGPRENSIDPKGERLAKMNFKHVALANPKLAPYGEAAKKVLQNKGLWEKLQGRLVLGENIAQTHQFVLSGNAELGFVAKSQVLKNNKIEGSFWEIPQELYSSLNQDALMLQKAKGNPAARSFLEFLKGPVGQNIISKYGYGIKTDAH